MKHPLKITGIVAVAALFLALAPSASAGVSVSVNLGGGYHGPVYGPTYSHGHGYPVAVGVYGGPVYYRPSPVVVYGAPRVVYLPGPYRGYYHGRGGYYRHCR